MFEIEDVLISARITRPYYAVALSALTPIARPGLGTVAVDKSWRLYYDIEWLNSMPLVKAGNIIAMHEVEHLLRKHHARAKAFDADPRRFNIAGDAEINDDVSESDLHGPHVRPCQFGCADHLLAEDYYDHVPEQSFTCGGGSGAGGEPVLGEIEEDNGMGASESRIIEAVANDVITHSKMYGNVPKGIGIWAESIIKAPEYSWRRALSRIVSKTFNAVSRGRSDYSYRKQTRKRTQGFIRPGLIGYTPTVGVLVDTSGSMSDLGGEVIGHVLSICRSVSTRVFECETSARPVQKGKKIKFTGGGGTDLRQGIRDASNGCDAVIVITDLETPWDDTPPHKNIIIVSVSKESSFPAWGKHVVGI